MPCHVVFPIGERRPGCYSSKTLAPCKRCSERKAMESLATCPTCKDLLLHHDPDPPSLRYIVREDLCRHCQIKFCVCRGKGEDCKRARAELRSRAPVRISPTLAAAFVESLMQGLNPRYPVPGAPLRQRSRSPPPRPRATRVVNAGRQEPPRELFDDGREEGASDSDDGFSDDSSTSELSGRAEVGGSLAAKSSDSGGSMWANNAEREEVGVVVEDTTASRRERPVEEADQQQRPVEEADQQRPVEQADQQRPVGEAEQQQRPVEEAEQQQQRPVGEAEQQQPRVARATCARQYFDRIYAAVGGLACSSCVVETNMKVVEALLLKRRCKALLQFNADAPEAVDTMRDCDNAEKGFKMVCSFEQEHNVFKVTGRQMLSIVVSVIRLLALPGSEAEEDLHDILFGLLRDMADCYSASMHCLLAAFEGHDKAMHTLGIRPPVPNAFITQRLEQLAAHVKGQNGSRQAFLQRVDEELGSILQSRPQLAMLVHVYERRLDAPTPSNSL